MNKNVDACFYRLSVYPPIDSIGKAMDLSLFVSYGNLLRELSFLTDPR